jgi:ring-1,2-phenylacetyl-CoA epoxidase subunit PaaC
VSVRNDLSPAAADYVLTLADDEHMIGARHTSWIGMGPFLEEDLAFCSIAQDELGHAIALYRLLTSDESITGVEVDALALGREPDRYRSSWLCEWPTEDWASALLRHWLYDLAEDLRWQNVAHSSVAGLAALVPGIQREESFHRHHGTSLLERLLTTPGPSDARTQLNRALSELSPIVDTLWVPPMLEADAIVEGVAALTFAELGMRWHTEVRAELIRLGLDAVFAPSPQADRSRRSSHFARLHDDLNAVRSNDPGAIW